MKLQNSQEKGWGKFHDLGLGNDLWVWHQNYSQQKQNKKAGIYHTKASLHCKGNNQQNAKVSYGMGDNTYRPYSDKGSVFKIHKKPI